MPDLRERLIEALNMAYEPLPIEDPHPALVKGQRHDGHGFMGACYVCQGDVAKLADAMLSVVGSWAGLMSLLDEHYPAEIFTGESGDEGPRIVSLVRELERERSSRQAWAAEAARLAWIHETHNHLLSPHKRVCACVTDEQAAGLDPRFSRPVCAVHRQPRVFPVGSPEPVDVLCVRSSVNGVIFQKWPGYGQWRAMEDSGGDGEYYRWHQMNRGFDGAEMVELVERVPGTPRAEGGEPE